MPQIEWPQLLPISLRLYASKAILETGVHYDEYLRNDASAAILDSLSRVGDALRPHYSRERRSPQEACQEGPAIDFYFGQVTAIVNEQFAARSKGSDQAETLLAALNVALEPTVCRECSASAGMAGVTQHLCLWTEASEAADAEAVERQGRCLKMLREIYEFAQHEVRSAYLEACTTLVVDSPILGTFHGLRNAEMELCVNAYTNESSPPLQARSVNLTLAVEGFEIGDYLSLPYLVFHEILAHGFCGVAIDAWEAEMSKPFHEGWMDCVAAYCMRESLRVHAGYAGNFGEAFLRRMCEVRSIRYNRTRQYGSTDVLKWIEGERAFHTFDRLFQIASKGLNCPDDGGAGCGAREKLILFSLTVNSSNLPHAERAAFCQAVNRNFSREGADAAERALRRRPPIVGLIQQFLNGGDAIELCKKVIAIR